MSEKRLQSSEELPHQSMSEMRQFSADQEPTDPQRRFILGYNEAQRNFFESLNADGLSPDVIEYFHVAVPLGTDRFGLATEQQKWIEQYLQGIINRLLGSDFARRYLLKDQPIPQFRFLIQDNQRTNASIYTRSTQPIMFITKDMVELLSNDGREDILAGLMAHEYTHYLVKRNADRSHNSKFEEGFADALPTFLLYFAGYQHDALNSLLSLLDSDDFGSLGKLLNYIDNHPGSPLRERIISDSTGFLAQYLRRHQMGFEQLEGVPATPLNRHFSELVETFHHTDVIDSAFEAAHISPSMYNEYGDYEKQPYQTLDEAKEKADFILTHFDEWLGDEKIGDWLVVRRSQKISKILYEIYGDTVSREAEYRYADIVPLLDKIITSPYPVHGEHLLKKVEETKKHQEVPAGLLKEFTDRLENFMSLASSEADLDEVRNLASHLKQIFERVHPEHRTILGAFELGDFPHTPWPEKIARLGQDRRTARSLGEPPPEGIDVPWNNLTDYALQEYQHYRSTDIADLLKFIGIQDPRLGVVPLNISLQTPQGYLVKYKHYGFPQMIIDGNGKIIGSAIENMKYWRSYEVKGSTQAFSREEAIDELKINHLARLRRIFRASENDTAADLENLSHALAEAIAKLQTPQDLLLVLETYPLLFTIPRRLMGGEINPDTHIPVGAEVCLALTNKLEELLQSDSQTWLPIIKTLFFQKEGTETNPSLSQLRRDMHSTYLDHWLSGQHNTLTLTGRNYEQQEIPIYLWEELGMSPQHPYFSFVISHTEGLATEANSFFSRTEALSILDATTFVEPRTFEGEEIQPVVKLTDVYFKLFGWHDFAETDEELTERLNLMKKVQPTIVLRKNWREAETETKHDWASLFLIYQARHEVFKFLSADSSRPISARLFEETLLLVEAQIDDLNEGQSGRTWVEEIGALLEEQLHLRARADLEGELSSVHQLAEAYVTFEKYGYFQRFPEIRWGKDGSGGYQSHLSLKIEELKQTGDYQNLLEVSEKLLFGCSIQAPEFRRLLIESWALANRHVLGVDPSMAFSELPDTGEALEYHEKVLEVAQKVCDLTPPDSVIHEQILNTLADQLETQNGLTEALSDLASRKTRNSLLHTKNRNRGPLAEFGLDFVISEEHTRITALNFLTTPLTQDSLDEFMDALAARQNKELLKTTTLGSSKVWIENFVKNPLDVLFTFATRKQDLTHPDTRREVAGRLRTAYNNFWDRSMEERAYYVNLIAFPHEGSYSSEQKTFKEYVAAILDKVLPIKPDTKENRKFNEYSQFGRDILTSYLADANQAEQRLLLSALMVSAKNLGQVEERTEQSIGLAMAHVLLNMGPAGVKLAQAVHSYPSLPEPIREGMTNVKGMANLPTRKQLFDRMRTVIPEHYTEGETLSLDKIEHVAALLGAGSYQYVINASLAQPLYEYDQVAIAILRENAYTFAANEFSHFDKTIDRYLEVLKQRRKKINSKALRQVLAQAKDDAVIETDYDIGRHQAELISESYRDLTVRIGDRTVAFTTVQWLDHTSNFDDSGLGRDILGYKVSNIAAGKPFNRFVVEHDESLVREVATAVQAAEDAIILSGRNFDHDRHGENFNVLQVDRPTQVGSVTLQPGDILVTGYDFGAVNIEPPTEHEKQLLGKIIGRTVAASLDNPAQFGSTLVKNLSQAVESEKESQSTGYLSAMLRGLFARGDFVRYLDETAAKEALGAVLATGVIDEQIMTAAMSEVIKASGKNIVQVVQMMNNLPESNRIVHIQISNQRPDAVQSRKILPKIISRLWKR